LYNFYVCDRKIIRASVAARHRSSELALCTHCLEPCKSFYRRLLCSERLSNSRIKRFVSYTQHTYKKHVASCTTSVYVNLSKNSFFLPFANFLRESGCKGTKNINTNQTFKQKNSQKHKSFREY